MTINQLFSAQDIPEISDPDERARRWRLVLGKDNTEQSQPQEGDQPQSGESDGSGEGDDDGQESQDGLSDADQDIDQLLESLYGDGDAGGFGDAAPDLARLLGDIRTYFTTPVAQMMQEDVIKRADLRKALLNNDFLAEVEPNIDLLPKLLTLSKLMPSETRETARQVVQQVVEELQEKLEYPLRQAITGSLNRALRARRPRRQKDINWLHTIKANLKHYQVEQKTVVPETLIGYGKQRSSLKDVILCIDQSGSMGQSVVYGSVFGAVMASVPALDTRMVLFSTSVVDVTDRLSDPVEVLFSTQLRGGTKISKALDYCQGLVTRPNDTILVLITDLYEGGKPDAMLRRIASLIDDGVQVVVLLALGDQGTPRFNRKIAQQLVDIGVPSFACTPDLFPDLMAAAINGQDIRQWAASNQIVTAPRN